MADTDSCSMCHQILWKKEGSGCKWQALPRYGLLVPFGSWLVTDGTFLSGNVFATFSTMKRKSRGVVLGSISLLLS